MSFGSIIYGCLGSIPYSFNGWLFLLCHFCRSLYKIFMVISYGPMVNKSDVFSLFPKFKIMIEIFFKTSINTIYSDGGTEYQGLKTMFANSGIQHLISPPYKPQHVASTKCRHHHIVETSLTLLHRTSLPLSLWSYAFNVAVCLIN